MRNIRNCMVIPITLMPLTNGCIDSQRREGRPNRIRKIYVTKDTICIPGIQYTGTTPEWRLAKMEDCPLIGEGIRKMHGQSRYANRTNIRKWNRSEFRYFPTTSNTRVFANG